MERRSYLAWMKQMIFLALLAVLCTGLSSGSVYICTGPNAKVYHYNKSCRGLNHCTHTIRQVAKSEAENMGRTLCGWED